MSNQIAYDDKVSVLVVDDSTVYRRIMADVVLSLPGAELAGTAPSGALALRKLEQQPVDLVLLDVSMPDMDGVETLQSMRERFPDTDAVMISGVSDRQAVTTIRALELGALDFIPKPAAGDADDGRRQLSDRLRPILRLVATRRYTRKIRGPGPEKTVLPAAPSLTVPVMRPSARPPVFELIVIGVSTGGPNALAAVVPCLPADCALPILLVQHMPPMFTASLAGHLARISSIDVREAEDGCLPLPGRVLIAPGGRHMLLRRSAGNRLVIAVNDDPPVNSCRPSVDVLFRSVAESDAGAALAVILTGMGDDGAAGVALLKDRGGYCIAQDEKTSVVYGMPRAVVERGLADEVLPLDRIGARMAALAKRGPR